ncbi:MAG: WD40 repeat domain-containing protein [Candidatus Thorarchaeota archaeon]|jgi:WD40 repeat protein
MEQRDFSLFLQPKIMKPQAERGSEITRRFAMNKVGRMVAVAMQDRSVRLYDAQNCEEMQRMQDEFLCTSIAFHPQGDVVATGGVDRVIKLWDIRSGELLAKLEGHTYPVLTLAFSPDGGRLVSGSGDTSLRIWDIANRTVINHLKGHSLYVVTCDWSPDGKRIISGEVDGTIAVWDAENGKLLKRLKDHRTAVQVVKFTPDGLGMASGSSDHSIIIWKTEGDSFKPERTLMGHEGEVRALSYSWDGKFMASGSSDKQLFVWSTDTYTIEGEGRTVSEVDGIEWYPNIDAFLTADGSGAIFRWEVKEMESMLAPFKSLLDEIEADSDKSRQDELIQKFNDISDQYEEEVLRDKRVFYILWQCKRALGLLKGTPRRT